MLDSLNILYDEELDSNCLEFRRKPRKEVHSLQKKARYYKSAQKP